MEINLISDTVTRPSAQMLEAMFKAKVGDDVFKQDPTVNALEQFVADIFGMEAALFFPSGTMANQTAIKLLTQPGDQLIADENSHIYHYEGGGVPFNSGVSCRLVAGHKGRINATLVEEAINPPDFYHSPLTTLVCIENTTNRGGGACYELSELEKIKEVCLKHQLSFHLDGARLWNALVAKQQKPEDFGLLFDTISVCLSKGLGAPVGSVLVSSKKNIDKALRVRKTLGGGMRQAGYLAAAGIYALENNISKLAKDHQRAKEIGDILATKSWIAQVEPVETNIVIFALKPNLDQDKFIAKLKERNILISSLGKGKLRIVTHLDYRQVMHDYFMEVLQKLDIAD
jgi:threonine aldolase